MIESHLVTLRTAIQIKSKLVLFFMNRKCIQYIYLRHQLSIEGDLHTDGHSLEDGQPSEIYLI